MGYYLGQRKNPCPRCGSKVWTAFISVSPMSYNQQCEGCLTIDYTPEEETLLGNNLPRHEVDSDTLDKAEEELERGGGTLYEIIDGELVKVERKDFNAHNTISSRHGEDAK